MLSSSIILILFSMLVFIGLTVFAIFFFRSKFIKTARAVIALYNQNIKYVLEKGDLNLQKNSDENFELEFSNVYEAIVELENLIDIAFGYHNSLGLLASTNSQLKEYEEELIKIKHKIKLFRWYNKQSN